MVTYISLLNFTEQGARSIKDTVKRFESAAKAGQEFGVKFKSAHWTMGQYDLVCEVEAKDEANLAAFTMAIAAQGNVKFQSLRAFSADEMKAFIAKMP